MRFTTPELEKELHNNVIATIFPNLIYSDKILLLKYFTRLIDVISYSFGFYEQKDNFVEQLRQNNYRDATGILFLLLPFINDTADKSNIKSFNDIYTAKQNINTDIAKQEPRYIYSNLQYGRCNRTAPITEIQFSEEHMAHNFYLLCDTVRIVSNKLFTNWINIVPFKDTDRISFNNSTVNAYKMNIMKAKNLDFYNFNPKSDISLTNIDDSELNDKLNRVQIDDIYDTITNDMYYAIKDIKWLIYEVVINGLRCPVNTFLADYFGNCYDEAARGTTWELLNIENRDKFTRLWDNIKDAIKNNKTISTINLPLSKDQFESMIRDILLFFNSHYRGMGLALKKKEYKIFRSVDMDKMDDELQSYSDVTFSDIKENILSLHPCHLFDFLKDSLGQFNDTFYGKVIIDKAGSERYYIPLFSGIMLRTPYINITLKNIYNFSKSFCHSVTKSNNFSPLPRYWRSLTKNLKQQIFDRLRDNETSWFNIKRYLVKYAGISRNDLDARQDDIRKKLLEYSLDFVINILRNKGTFTRFNFNLDMTDERNIPADKRRDTWPNMLKKRIFDNEEKDYESSVYFLTGTQYKHMKKFDFTMKDKSGQDITYSDKSYFEFNSMYGWYVAYALDWVSQLSFFHKYLNNRIIFVTGSTGVGKSTQVPKLLLYAIKAIDYKSISNIVCTQPRLKPTEDNATQVSLEMGVPIGTSELLRNKYNNYNLQFKTQYKNHVKYIPNVVLSFVTDGLLNQVLDNPLAKSTSLVKEKRHKLDSPSYKCRIENKYDIVMVDEAHEHNKNMDLVLTYMKYATAYNNSLKLVIISATMDDDEPIYRRYFRDINDNRMFPLNTMIQDNMLDRINVDRRLHISPPGQTTRFRIDDIYVDGINLDCKNIKKTLPDPQIAINLVLDLASKEPTSTSSDILFFQPGLADVRKNVQELNKILPDYAIAVPFHGQMSDKYRDIVGKIHKNKKTIKLSKEDDFELVDPTIGSGSYTKFIIVATNIAEASITIDTLKYVIETGIQKTSSYSYKNKTSVLNPTCISESSRLQRRGRVGRTASGIVYYMYQKNLMINNKTQYQMSIDNINTEIYRRLRESHDLLFFSNLNDPNKPNITISDSLYPNNDQTGILDIIHSQYYILDIFYSYYGVTDHYDYSNYKSLPETFKSGFNLKTLLDETGEHYIIHPEELSLQRNIAGQITAIKDPDNIKYIETTRTIISNKIISFVDDLKAYLFIVGTNIDNMIKTSIGKKMFEYKTVLEIDSMSHFMSYMYSKLYDCEEMMVRFIALSMALPTTYFATIFTGTTVDGKYRSNMGKYKVSGTSSDMYYLIAILDKFHKLLASKNIPTDLENDVFFSDYAYNPLIYDKKTVYNKFRSDGLIIKVLLDSIKNIDSNITSLCDKLYISKTFVLTYLEKYLTIKNKAYCANNSDVIEEQTFIADDLLTSLAPLVKSGARSLEDRFTICLLAGYPYNILYNINQSPYYLSIYNPIISNIYKIKPIGKTNLTETLVDQKYVKKFIMYTNVNIEDNTVALLHYIKPEFLMYLFNVYSIAQIKAKYNTLQLSQLTIKEDDVNTVSQIFSIYIQTLREIKKELIDNYNTSAQLDYVKLDPPTPAKPEFKLFSYANRSSDEYYLQTGGTQKITKNIIKKLIKKEYNH
jgi:hypothetical protein